MICGFKIKLIGHQGFPLSQVFRALGCRKAHKNTNIFRPTMFAMGILVITLSVFSVNPRFEFGDHGYQGPQLLTKIISRATTFIGTHTIRHWL
jgi:hypothetical protein